MKRLERYIIQSVSVLVFSALACGQLAAQNRDINMLKEINVNRNQRLDGTMIAVTKSVFPLAIGVPAAGLVTGYFTHDKSLIENSVQTISGLGLAAAISVGIKYSVNNPRPFVTYSYIDAYKDEATPCFPSAHTSCAFSLATSVSLNTRRWYIVAPAYMWATAAGYSRMHLGVHYPSDVLVGAMVGTGSAWLAYKGNELLHKRRRHKHAPISNSIQ